ncbi:hypothetical protein NQT69_05740 [Pseudoalteromonas shioyasakiensis]|uniref:hypothetical protein n=1 Tax=Pseudoalteromonas shioyasakiensis TaxID=1190813 RepID=UPI002119098C|nr:hypothetical protein [Pseudoalteromonas shioyasakiensis]MCQ8877533.1 hypothetical protein [Pseudoalteromonas shioyasakiensis]
MEKFKQGLNQFWVGAVFGVCLALSLVLIPLALVMSTVNDVLKVQEVSTLVSQVTQMVEKTQNKLANTKQKFAAFSFKELDKTALINVITAVQDYQLQSHTLLDDKQKQALSVQLQARLKQELAQHTLSEEQRELAINLYKRFIATEAELEQTSL